MKRVSVKRKCPNPLFEKWLQEWKEEAAAKDSAMQYCFGKALKSLRKYPLVLKSGKECAILQNFGTRLCVMLDRKLTEYKKSNPELNLDGGVVSDGVTHDLNSDVPEENANAPKVGRKRKKQIPAVSPARNTISPTKTDISGSPKKRSSNSSESYVPAFRSGPYALLLTIYRASKETGYQGYMGKKELQSRAQLLCDNSFTKPLPGSFYTAWSSMTLLERKGFVRRYGNPAKFSLTESGVQLAEKLEEVDKTQASKPECSVSGTVNRLKSSDIYSKSTDCVATCSTITSVEETYENNSQNSNQSAGIYSDSTDTVIFMPGTFKVILLVDTGENSTSMVHELNTQCASYEIRHLKAGDFMWICRERNTGKELVLPYIVERKRMDDLGKSIKDGRFHEQKFRLKQCGLKNLIYLVESHGNDAHVGLPLSTLHQAMINTQVVDGFTVHCTKDLRQAVSYLCTLTQFLSKTFCSKTLLAHSREGLPEPSIHHDIVSLLTFEELQKISGKLRRHKVKDMFVKHLLQLKGLSVDKALAVVQKYPTPRLLMNAYDESGGNEDALANLLHGSLDRKLGPVVSKSLYKLYMNPVLS